MSNCLSSGHLLQTGPGQGLRKQNPPSLCATEVFLALGGAGSVQILLGIPRTVASQGQTEYPTRWAAWRNQLEIWAGPQWRVRREKKDRESRSQGHGKRGLQGLRGRWESSWEERPSLLGESPSCFACCYGKITPGKQLTRGRFYFSHGSRLQPAILGKPQSQEPEVGGHAASRVRSRVTSVSQHSLHVSTVGIP